MCVPFLCPMRDLLSLCITFLAPIKDLHQYCVTFLCVPIRELHHCLFYIYVCPNKGPEPLYVTFLASHVGPEGYCVTVCYIFDAQCGACYHCVLHNFGTQCGARRPWVAWVTNELSISILCYLLCKGDVHSHLPVKMSLSDPIL